MRARGIERNVHTFSALMNVCVKCGQYRLALDVYREMQAEVGGQGGVWGVDGKWGRTPPCHPAWHTTGVTVHMRGETYAAR
jgi:pentatricopeptide repeat protein